MKGNLSTACKYGGRSLRPREVGRLVDMKPETGYRIPKTVTARILLFTVLRYPVSGNQRQRGVE